MQVGAQFLFAPIGLTMNPLNDESEVAAHHYHNPISRGVGKLFGDPKPFNPDKISKLRGYLITFISYPHDPLSPSPHDLHTVHLQSGLEIGEMTTKQIQLALEDRLGPKGTIHTSPLDKQNLVRMKSTIFQPSTVLIGPETPERIEQLEEERSSMLLSVYQGLLLKKWTEDHELLPYFGHFITSLIILNTLSLAADYPDKPDSLAQVLEVSNLIFTIAFTLEVLLKVLAFGIREYIDDGFNIFDAVVVLFSLIEYSLPGDSSGLSVLRLFRLLRVFKLARNWKQLRDFLQTITDSLSSMACSFHLCIITLCSRLSSLVFHDWFL